MWLRQVLVRPFPLARCAVIGVVGDVWYGGLAAPPPDAIYLPFAQFPFQHMNLVVRTSGNPFDLASAVRSRRPTACRS